MKKFLTNSLLLFVSLAVCVFFLECAIRVILPWYDPSRQVGFYTNADGVPLGKPDAIIHQRTPKGDYNLSSRFNKYGFRDPKDLALSKDGDWFVLGDSFSFGWGIPDGGRYSDLLEKELARPVYNIAIPTDIKGYQGLLAYARGKGARIASLILGICMENDLVAYSQKDVEPKKRKDRAGSSFRDFLKGSSAVYLALSYELQKFPAVRVILEKIGVARDVEARIKHNTADEAVLVSSTAEVMKILRTVRVGVVLIIPSRSLWAGNNRKNEARAHDRFVELLREQGARVVDMRPVFERTGHPLDYYFKTDPHWNEAGHRLAAETIPEALADVLARCFGPENCNHKCDRKNLRKLHRSVKTVTL